LQTNIREIHRKKSVWLKGSDSGAACQPSRWPTRRSRNTSVAARSTRTASRTRWSTPGPLYPRSSAKRRPSLASWGIVCGGSGPRTWSCRAPADSL